MTWTGNECPRAFAIVIFVSSQGAQPFVCSRFMLTTENDSSSVFFLQKTRHWQPHFCVWLVRWRCFGVPSFRPKPLTFPARLQVTTKEPNFLRLPVSCTVKKLFALAKALTISTMAKTVKNFLVLHKSLRSCFVRASSWCVAASRRSIDSGTTDECGLVFLSAREALRLLSQPLCHNHLFRGQCRLQCRLAQCWRALPQWPGSFSRAGCKSSVFLQSTFRKERSMAISQGLLIKVATVAISTLNFLSLLFIGCLNTFSSFLMSKEKASVVGLNSWCTVGGLMSLCLSFLFIYNGSRMVCSPKRKKTVSNFNSICYLVELPFSLHRSLIASFFSRTKSGVLSRSCQVELKTLILPVKFHQTFVKDLQQCWRNSTKALHDSLNLMAPTFSLSKSREKLLRCHFFLFFWCNYQTWVLALATFKSLEFWLASTLLWLHTWYSPRLLLLKPMALSCLTFSWTPVLGHCCPCWPSGV